MLSCNQESQEDFHQEVLILECQEVPRNAQEMQDLELLSEAIKEAREAYYKSIQP